ncbi:BED-type domain-containing protein [Citrus sinensis]|uniref:BED-type domain-containing protein n=1 Tax=Citrus sinensis TaxID=2711 RepID=A0ACB8KA66_CITSI|nr:BED-type domain-containing protein [Citrus sinensis]
MSNYSRVQDNLDCVADDFEHEVEVNDNENDSATIFTGGNKRKKSSSSKPPLPRKKMAPRSTVWQHFTRVPNDDTKCKCNYCGQEFECGTVGDEVVARGFSQEACRRATMKMIVLDELPLSVVENPGFRHFCSVAAPRYLLPSRRTISRDTLEMYLEENAKLKSLLMGNKLRVSLTTNIWTSITTASYVVITAHFIDRDWNLHRKIISFNTVNDHSSETISKQLEKCLIDWGIERVFTVTVDNASLNEGALRHLIDRVKTWRDDGLVLNGDYLHVRCCAHILNLIVTEGLKELEHSIVSVRNAVKYVRSSTAMMQAFQICVQQEKINCREIVILDCPTSVKCVEMKEMVKNLLIKLYESYNVQYKPGGSGSASGSASGSTSGSPNLAIGSGSGSNFWDLGDDDDVMIEDPFSEFSKAVAVSEGSPELSNELDLYLMEKTKKIAKTRDVLAIPVSTVAFKSSFSTGGRILDQYRSSLTPDMMEALVLLQNWLRTSLFVDTTADINKLVEDNEFMDQLAEGIFCKTLI